MEDMPYALLLFFLSTILFLGGVFTTEGWPFLAFLIVSGLGFYVGIHIVINTYKSNSV
jgi:hypothetical protein